MIRVLFQQIPEAGLDFEGDFNPDLLEIATDSRLLKFEPVKYQLHLSRVEHQLLVEGRAEVTMHCICDRCLEKTAITIGEENISHHIAQPSDSMDLTEYIREDIVLAFPSVFACQAGCDTPYVDEEEINFYQEEPEDDKSPWDILDGLK